MAFCCEKGRALRRLSLSAQLQHPHPLQLKVQIPSTNAYPQLEDELRIHSATAALIALKGLSTRISTRNSATDRATSPGQPHAISMNVELGKL